MTVVPISFFFKDTAPTEIYTLSLHDALPIFSASTAQWLATAYMLVMAVLIPTTGFLMQRFTTRTLYLAAMGVFSVGTLVDRKSTRLNSSHANISYAVFCLKKKKTLPKKSAGA